MANLIERHAQKIVGVLSCFDSANIAIAGSTSSMTTTRPCSRSSAAASGNTYKYYLTQLGRHVAIAGLTLKNMFLVPEFATAAIAY